MDPVSASFKIKAASEVAGGLAGLGQAKAEQKQAQINNFIGRTRAIQTGADATRGLNSELGQMRNVMGANQQAPGVGTFEVMNELRETRNRERNINVGNRNSEAAAYQMQGKAAGQRGFSALTSGLLRSGPSLFRLREYLDKEKNREF